ncbi:site-specific integrase [Sphingomonas sp. JC676]|nr:site-specific integrase [Sphingomonas sp. JC676]
MRMLLRRAELCCSLRTTNAGIAGGSARLMYLRSEELFADLRLSPMLSDADLARMVQDFYATVLDRENQLRLLGRLSTNEEGRQARLRHWIDVAEDARSDLACSNFGSADFTAAWAIKKSGLTGKLNDHEVRQVQQAMLRGGVDLAQALKARYEGDFSYTPTDQLLRMELARAIEAPVVIRTEPATAENRPAAVDAPLFTEAAENFRKAQIRHGNWELQTAAQARKSYQLFAEMAGDRPLSEYVRDEAVRIKNLLRDLPADYGKAAKYRGLVATDIATMTSDLQVARLSPRTAQRHINALSTLWESAIEAGHAQTNIFAGFKFASAKRAHEQRAMWTEDQLNALFSSPVWSGCKSELRRSKPGAMVIRDERYWLPLIAVFSGLRQEEICQLTVNDVRTEQGIWVFDINATAGEKRLKNANAVRLVPIHSQLISLGLLEYVEEQRAAGEDRVFPRLQGGGADSRLGHNFSKWFTRYRKDVKLYEAELDFHSFRHSATTFMQWSNVPEPVIDRLTGHATHGETARYTKSFQIEQLQEGIEGIRPKLTLEGLPRSQP